MPSSLRGQFLIAGRSMRDPNFFKTVVLLVEHNDSGAMGLVINRPSGVSVARALSDHFELPETDEMVYVGGPVDENALFILHNAAELEQVETPVIPGLFVGSSAEVFTDVVQRVAAGDESMKFRVYFGCAGWAPEQLESEIRRKDWLVCPANNELTFHSDPYAVWELALREVRRLSPLAPGAESDSGWN